MRASIGFAIAISLAAEPTGSGGTWRWPTDNPRSIIRPFIAPATPYSRGHRGIDVLAVSGVIYAPADGVVRFAGTVVDRPVLSITHGSGVVSSFEPVVSTLRAGQAVSRGQQVGVAIAGHCSALCVHVGVRVNGQYVSPLNYFGNVPRSVLRPTRRRVQPMRR